MARALGEDLRLRVLKAANEGASARQAAALFGVGVSSAIRWIALAKIGELAPRQQGRRRGSRLDEYADFIIGMIEMVARLEAEQSVRIGRSTLSDCLRGTAGHSKKVRTCTGVRASRHPETPPRLVRRSTRSRPGEVGLHR